MENAGLYHPNTIASVDISQVLVEGETYTVVWDGVRYENLVGTKAGINNSVTLGSLDASFNDYPFFLTVDEVMNFGEVDVWCNSAGSHTFTIYKTNKNIKTLDEKYIPDTIARTEVIEESYVNLSSDQSVSGTKTFENGIILKSPNGTRFNITIGDDGVLSATEITS